MKLKCTLEMFSETVEIDKVLSRDALIALMLDTIAAHSKTEQEALIYAKRLHMDTGKVAQLLLYRLFVRAMKGAECSGGLAEFYAPDSPVRQAATTLIDMLLATELLQV